MRCRANALEFCPALPVCHCRRHRRGNAVTRKILTVPRSLTIEADEYLFTHAGALTDSVILTELLTNYRIQGAKLFMTPGVLVGGECRKERTISTFAFELRHAFSAAGAPPDPASAVLELVDAEAAQLRLQLDSGKPWETFRCHADQKTTEASGRGFSGAVLVHLARSTGHALPKYVPDASEERSAHL